MRKSVIFIISIIYIASIVIVTFFGMQISMDQFPIVFDSIEITSYDEVVSGKKFLYIDFDETEGYGTTFITYKYSPKNVTHPDKVEFAIVGNNEYVDEHGEKHVYASIDQFGRLVVFKANRLVTVTITTTDDAKKSDTVRVYCE